MKYVLRTLPTLLLLAVIYGMAVAHQPAPPLDKAAREATTQELHHQMRTLHTQLEELEKPSPSLPRGVGR
jgi:hypothetical protein